LREGKAAKRHHVRRGNPALPCVILNVKLLGLVCIRNVCGLRLGVTNRDGNSGIFPKTKPYPTSWEIPGIFWKSYTFSLMLYFNLLAALKQSINALHITAVTT
jgi:hypothetical protein